MRHGFTILELLGVLLLLALLSTAAAISLRSVRTTKDAQGFVQSLAAIDRQMRCSAVQTGEHGQILFDLANQRIIPVHGGQRSGSVTQTPDSLRLTGMIVEGKASDGGCIPVAFSTKGWSPTYALEVQDHGTDPPNRFWLLFPGLTGEMIKVESHDEIRNIFATTARLAAGHDTP